MVTLKLGDGTEVELLDADSILARVADRATARDMGGPERPISGGEAARLVNDGKFVRVMDRGYWRVVQSARVS